MMVRTHDMVVVESSSALHEFAPQSINVQRGYKGQSLYQITSPEDASKIEMLQKISNRCTEVLGLIGTSMSLSLLRITPDERSDNLLYTFSQHNVQICYAEANGSTILLTFVPREEDLEQLQTTDEYWAKFNELGIESGQEIILNEDSWKSIHQDAILPSEAVPTPITSDLWIFWTSRHLSVGNGTKPRTTQSQ
jgi:hypothetical protein